MRTHHALHRALCRRLDAVHGDSGVGRRVSDDRGMSAIEFVFLTPLFFAIIFITIQFAMYYFADHIAVAAARAGAREGAEQAKVSSDWRDQSRAKARWYIDQLGGGLLSGAHPEPNLQGNTVTMTVTGSVPTVVPWIHLHVTAVSSSPVERFVPDGGQ
jgi:Flp pilus assembly protein TadG